MGTVCSLSGLSGKDTYIRQKNSASCAATSDSMHKARLHREGFPIASGTKTIYYLPHLRYQRCLLWNKRGKKSYSPLNDSHKALRLWCETLVGFYLDRSIENSLKAHIAQSLTFWEVQPENMQELVYTYCVLFLCVLFVSFLETHLLSQPVTNLTS